MAKGNRQFTEGEERARQKLRVHLAGLAPPMSQADLARKSEVTTVGQLLNGQRWPQPASLGKIEQAAGLPPGTIEAWRDGRPPPEDQVTRAVTVPRLDEASDVQLAEALLARIQRRGG